MKPIRISTALMALALAACAPLATPASTFTAAPAMPTATIPPTDTPQPTVAPRPAPVLKPAHQIDPALPIHDVILFNTSRVYPLLIADEEPYLPLWPEYKLYAVSPDGTRSGSIADRSASPNVAWHFRGDPLERLYIVAAFPIGFQDERIKLLSLADCQDGVSRLPCQYFAFSPDGAWLAFNAFDDFCGQALLIVPVGDDGQVGTSQLLAARGSHRFGFLPDGRLLAAIGHCEGGWVHLIDPASGDDINLGAEGASSFSANGTSLIVQDNPYVGWGAGIWGFNLETNLSFAALDGESDGLAWAPDGQTALYQHRSLRFDRQTHNTYLGARGIVALNAINGDSKVLTADARYDYHLCSAWNRPCEWRDDWVLARRIAFRFADHPFPLGSIGSDPVETCLRFGLECPDATEHVGINWRTGEARSWAEIPEPSPPPTPIPTPAPAPGPDTSRPPVYADPSGGFAFYVGRDGQSLWMVPASGEPVLWVIEGENFVYIP